MWKAYLNLDQKILSLFQEGYLWLLDRTGVYVATVAFLIYAVIALMEISNGSSLWIWGPLVAFVGLAQSNAYRMQDRAQNEKFNLIAMMMEVSRLRHYFNLLLIALALSAMLTLDVRFFFSQFGFVAYGYVMLVKIRDRDKKPFFEKAPDLAMQRHGSN